MAVKAKAKIVKNMLVSVLFEEEKAFEQFMHINSLHPKEMNKLLPKELQFTEKEIEDFTWMEVIQESVQEVTNNEIIDS